MIYFVTNDASYQTSIDTRLFPDITIIPEEGAFDLFFKLIGKQKVLALDIEATGLDAYTTTPLLYGIGTKTIQFMMDWTVDIKPYIVYLKRQNKVILGHNLKYDIKLVKTNTGIMLHRIYDTMLAEQRLWMKSGYLFAYAELVRRYLGKAIIKSTRNEFIGVNIDTFKINASHLYYLRGDLTDLYDIRKKQRVFMKKFKMEFLIYGIEFPLAPIVGLAELEGFVLNKDKWLARIKAEQDELLEVELALDEEVRRLRDFVEVNELYKTHNPKYLLAGNKFNTVRTHNSMYDMFKADGTTTTENIFGEMMTHQQLTGLKKKIVKNPNNINYSAKKEIVFIFAALNQPMITPNEQFSVPQLSSTGKLVGSINTYTIKEDFLQKYLLQKPNTIMKDFIELKIKHSKLEKAITTYGESFITKLNPVTGKLHTAFRQCDAATGRFQSGGGAKEPDKPNFQNIPAKLAYRECFTVEEGYSVITADYSGAELIVMASHAQDFKLIELSEQDMHSYMATKCWRNVFGHRAKQLLNLFTKNPGAKKPALTEEYNKNVELYRTYTITKEQKDKRTAFKPLTFGTIYGMYPKKAGASLDIIPEEGKVVIDTIKSELPLTFRMVEKASTDAENQGYVILNERTNSRAWFPYLIRQLKGEVNKQTHFKEISEELSAARNIRIQGTQADFVKEATVALYKILSKAYVDSTILSWVHDEIVIKIPKYLDGYSQEWIDFLAHNPKFTLTSPITGKEYDNLPELVKEVLEEVANRYLCNVKIQVELETKPNWIK